MSAMVYRSQMTGLSLSMSWMTRSLSRARGVRSLLMSHTDTPVWAYGEVSGSPVSHIVTLPHTLFNAIHLCQSLSWAACICNSGLCSAAGHPPVCAQPPCEHWTPAACRTGGSGTASHRFWTYSKHKRQVRGNTVNLFKCLPDWHCVSKEVGPWSLIPRALCVCHWRSSPDFWISS